MSTEATPPAVSAEPADWPVVDPKHLDAEAPPILAYADVEALFGERQDLRDEIRILDRALGRWQRSTLESERARMERTPNAKAANGRLYVGGGDTPKVLSDTGRRGGLFFDAGAVQRDIDRYELRLEEVERRLSSLGLAYCNLWAADPPPAFWILRAEKGLPFIDRPAAGPELEAALRDFFDAGRRAFAAPEQIRNYLRTFGRSELLGELQALLAPYAGQVVQFAPYVAPPEDTAEDEDLDAEDIDE